MSLSIECRNGTLSDVSRLKFGEGLPISGEGEKFNVLGVGHEYWIAVQANTLVGISILGRWSRFELRIMLLEVAPSRKNEGVGSGLLQKVMENYPECMIYVIPFEGTEEFYRHLGFISLSRWERHRELC